MPQLRLSLGCIKLTVKADHHTFLPHLSYSSSPSPLFPPIFLLPPSLSYAPPPFLLFSVPPLPPSLHLLPALPPSSYLPPPPLSLPLFSPFLSYLLPLLPSSPFPFFSQCSLLPLPFSCKDTYFEFRAHLDISGYFHPKTLNFTAMKTLSLREMKATGPWTRVPRDCGGEAPFNQL